MELAFRPLNDPANRIDAMDEGTRRKLAAWSIAVQLVLLAAWAIATPRHTPWRITSDGVHVDWVF